jgi:hypothetical protein
MLLSLVAPASSEVAAAVPVIQEIQLLLTDEARAHLASRPRDLVPVQWRWNGTNVVDAQIRLKGSTGSFRPLSDRPAFTVVWDCPATAEAPGGRRSMHLNNAVEDSSRLQQALAASWFREAGVPAPAIAHARVLLNGKRLGLYVTEEGIDAAFLRREFPGVSARSLGEDDRIPALEALPEQGDAVALKHALEATVDVAECVRYFAVEAVSGHRDGYLAARNNFRMVERIESHQRLLLPHGMDQFVGTAEFPWNPAPGGRLAQWILGQSAGRRQFELEVRAQVARLGDEAAWVARFDRLALPWIASLTPDEATEIVPSVDALRERVRARARGVARQLAGDASPPDAPLLPGESRRLLHWRLEVLAAHAGASGSAVSSSLEPGGVGSLHARFDEEAAVIWKASLRLAPGHYRFEGRVRSRDLEAMRFGQRHGASLCVAGHDAAGAGLLGTREWTSQSVELDLSGVPGESVPVELRCEARARSGEAWFDGDSLRLQRLD